MNIYQFIRYNWWVKTLKLELHRNLLFPLTLKNGSDEKQQNLEEKEYKLTGSEDGIVGDNNGTSLDEHTSKYEGLITRSRAKKEGNTYLLKANILMSNHFND